jgi:hypothetical protein
MTYAMDLEIHCSIKIQVPFMDPFTDIPNTKDMITRKSLQIESKTISYAKKELMNASCISFSNMTLACVSGGT